jgi:hypothetical protein
MRKAWLSAAVVAVVMAAGALLHTAPAAAQRKKITLDDLIIEGNIQKPEAFFILPRTNLNFSDLERREDLKTRIIKSVEKNPF